MTAMSRQSGFTLIELLVAMSIVLLMMFLIDRLFFETTRAVSRGTSFSEIIQHSRGMGEQLAEDASEMLPKGEVGGSSNYGMLLIVQREIPNVRLHDPRAPGDITTGLPRGEVVRDVRSDQILFFSGLTAGAKRVLPQVPARSTTFDPTPVAGTPQARIWYGHVLITNPDGTDPNGTLGQDIDGNPNRYANRWILGRQTLMLHRVDGDGPSAVPDTHAVWRETGAPSEQMRLPRFDAEVEGDMAGSVPVGVPTKLYQGLADVALCQIKGGATWSAATDLAGTAALFDLNDPRARFRGLTPPLIADSYLAEAVEYIYVKQRLRANPAPSASLGYPSWAVGQMHPSFLSRISDFVVEFAGDYDPATTGIDVDADGNIKWYSHFPNEPGSPTFDATLAASYPIPVGVGGFDNSYARQSIYAHNGSTPPLPAAATEADAMIVFRHDDYIDDGGVITTRWPHLLRIRYRLHDRRGDLSSENNQHGIWFEEIVKVRRSP